MTEAQIEKKREYNRRRYRLNPERIKEQSRQRYRIITSNSESRQKHRNERAAYVRRYRLKNPESMVRGNNSKQATERRQRWITANPELNKESKRSWKKRNPDYDRNRALVDLNYRICLRLRGRLHKALSGYCKAARTLELLGCTIKEFRSWLSGQFQPGMSWENYGQWHIDHRRPCASFDLSDPTQQRQCFHYLNLQPLWAKDNFSKAANYGIRSI